MKKTDARNFHAIRQITRKVLRGIGIIVFCLALIAAVGPFLVPVPAPGNTRPIADLVDADSRFIEVNGLRVHYKQAGQGKPYIILLHGFGASQFSWREVMAPLGRMGAVIAYDRPAFGLTDRPMTWQGPNPYSTQANVDLLIGLMDGLGIERAVLVGNSAGGAVAALAALEHPQRVDGLVLVDPALGSGNFDSPLVNLLLATPQANHLGPLLVRSIQERGDEIILQAWHDPGKIPGDVIAGYRKPLQAENWDRALWYFTTAPRPEKLYERVVAGLTMPVLVVTGDDDRIVPTQQSVRLGGELPGAKLVVFERCGHVPQEECPQAFLTAIVPFIEGK